MSIRIRGLIYFAAFCAAMCLASSAQKWFGFADGSWQMRAVSGLGGAVGCLFGYFYGTLLRKADEAAAREARLREAA